MFVHSFRNIPGAAHSGRKGYKVSSLKTSGIPTVSWRDGHLSLEQVTRFIGIIRPGKLADITTPSSPRKDTFLLEKVLIGLSNDLNFRLGRRCRSAHGKNRRRRRARDGNKPQCWGNEQRCNDCLHCHVSK